MTTLQVEHQISDFDTWKAAFDRDPIDRRGSGVREYRVYQPVDDRGYIKVELDFDDKRTAESFLEKLQGLWRSGAAAPALVGEGSVQLVEQVAKEDLR